LKGIHDDLVLLDILSIFFVSIEFLAALTTISYDCGGRVLHIVY
jgi:hypothetical protein